MSEGTFFQRCAWRMDHSNSNSNGRGTGRDGTITYSRTRQLSSGKRAFIEVKKGYMLSGPRVWNAFSLYPEVMVPPDRFSVLYPILGMRACARSVS